jgi:hypothetical protein
MLMAWLPICGVVGRWGLVENYWENALEGDIGTSVLSSCLSFLLDHYKMSSFPTMYFCQGHRLKSTSKAHGVKPQKL